MIRVLVAEDSPTVQLLLEAILHSDPGIQVIGRAMNGAEAVRKTFALRPDLVTMDIRMPVMDGLEATRHIMHLRPTPVVVVSAHVDMPDLQIAFHALRAGALDVIPKPFGIEHADFNAASAGLLSAVKLMSEVKVIGRQAPSGATSHRPPFRFPSAGQALAVLAIGASTGGPAALKLLLDALPADFPIPIVVVQHMALGFLEGLVGWLQPSSALRLCIAKREPMLPGSVYFAPPDQHLQVRAPGMLKLSRAAPVSHVRPSATVLFESLAACYGAQAAGVLLTGMGDDGAAGLRMIRERGGTTLAQDEATSVVWGMPKAALALDAVSCVLPIEQIAAALVKLAWEGR